MAVVVAVMTRSEKYSEQSPRNHRGWYSRGYLPHFDSPHLIQHITYRLADSLPSAVLENMRDEAAAGGRDDEERKTELRRRVEVYLDAGHGSCVLKEPEVAACVVDTWLRFDGERYRLLEWVVMPNHCHVLIEPLDGCPLGKIVLSWKNYTARFINKYIRRTGVRRSHHHNPPDGRTGVRRSYHHNPPDGRTGVRRSYHHNPLSGRTGVRRSRVWQRDYWDRFIRDQRHFAAVKDYIIMNPVNAGLVSEAENWPWSSAKIG